MHTTNQRELQKLLEKRQFNTTMLFVGVIVVLSVCIIIAMREDYKEAIAHDKDLLSHKSEQIRILQMVTHGCDRCSEQVQRSQRK